MGSYTNEPILVTDSPNPLTSNAVTMKHTNFSNGPLDLNYYDPTPSAISKFNQMMFRGALMSIGWPHLANLTDPDVSIYQNVAALETIQLNAYQTDLRWYAGAAVLELMTVLLILPMFWGWWYVYQFFRTYYILILTIAFPRPQDSGTKSDLFPSRHRSGVRLATLRQRQLCFRRKWCGERTWGHEVEIWCCSRSGAYDGLRSEHGRGR